MDIVVQAALSEILGRFFSFLIDNFPWWRPGARDVHRRRLEQLLGNISSIVEEAEGRHITNQQMLTCLKALIEGMYRGRFALEVTDLEDADADADGGAAAATTVGKSKRSLCSSFNRAKKRSRVTSLILGGGDDGAKRLATAVEELESLDFMGDFIRLVQGYPRKVDRPVRTTLYMDRCVFGRHVEKERIVDFLLQRAPPGRAPYLSVLAVLGGWMVGKTTLVKHACDDERVRGHFARIEWFGYFYVLKAGGRSDQTKWTGGGAEYLAGVRRILGEPRFAAGRSLLVFDDACCIDESAWAELAAYPSALADGSKLLFTSRHAGLARLSTVEPVVLETLQQEEFWYYFKAFAFGGADPREHPRIAAVGREISEHVNMERRFVDAQVLGALLRANFDVRFWRRVLAAMGKCKGWPTMIFGVLAEILPVRGRPFSIGYCPSPRKFTVHDVLSARAGDGGGDSEEVFSIFLSRETLYMDGCGWYNITFRERRGGVAAAAGRDLA